MGSGGYDAAYDFFGPSYFTILDKSLLGQGFSMINRYMFYGGTNWAIFQTLKYIPPMIIQHLSVNGVLSTTYAAMKKVGMFVEAFPDLIAASDHMRCLENIVRSLGRSTGAGKAFMRIKMAAPMAHLPAQRGYSEEYRTHIQVEWQAGIHTIPQAPDLFIPLPKRSMRMWYQIMTLEDLPFFTPPLSCSPVYLTETQPYWLCTGGG